MGMTASLPSLTTWVQTYASSPPHAHEIFFAQVQASIVNMFSMVFLPILWEPFSSKFRHELSKREGSEASMFRGQPVKDNRVLKASK